jgi:hypothetical protein
MLDAAERQSPRLERERDGSRFLHLAFHIEQAQAMRDHRLGDETRLFPFRDGRE